MNAGKVIAEIAVVVIIVACCYNVIMDAVPHNINDLSNPVEVSDMNLSASTEGLDVKIDVEGSVTSRLPQDLVDVYLTMYIGEVDARMKLGEINLGTISAERTTVIDEELDIPMYAVLAYTSCASTTSSDITLPLCAKIAFKYLEWQDSYLIDMDLTVKQDFSMATICEEGGVPDIEFYHDDVTAKVEITADSGLIRDVAKDLSKSYPDGILMTCGGATLDIDINTSGNECSISFEASGSTTGSTDAVEELQKFMDEKGHLSFTYNGNTYDLDNEQSKSFIEVIQTLYDAGDSDE